MHSLRADGVNSAVDLFTKSFSLSRFVDLFSTLLAFY